MLTNGEKIGVGVIAASAVGTVIYVFSRPSLGSLPSSPHNLAPKPQGASIVTTIVTPGPAPKTPTSPVPAPATSIPQGPFVVHLPGGPAPFAGAAVVDVTGDVSAQPLVAALPPGTGDYAFDDQTIGELAQYQVYPRDPAKPGKWVLLVSAGSFSSSIDEASAVLAADQNFKQTYDRVVWVPYVDMPKASFDAITQYAGEYIALMNHDATPEGLRAILYGTGAAGNV